MTTPAYQRIATELRDAIYTGRLKRGAKLPSLNQISSQYDVAPETAKRAVDVLKHDELVVSEHGRGTFVVRDTPLIHRYGSRRHIRSKRPPGSRPFDAELERESQHGEQEILAIERVIPPANVAYRLGVDEREEVLVCRYLLRADDIPVARVDSYYRLQLAAGTVLETREHAGMSIDYFLMDELGLDLDHFETEIQAQDAGKADEFGALDLQPNAPVIRLLRTLYDTDGKPIQVSDQCLVGDKYVLAYDEPIR